MKLDDGFLLFTVVNLPSPRLEPDYKIKKHKFITEFYHLLQQFLWDRFCVLLRCSRCLHQEVQTQTNWLCSCQECRDGAAYVVVTLTGDRLDSREILRY